MEIRKREIRKKIVIPFLTFFIILMLALLPLLLLPIPSTCRQLMPPSPPKVTEIILSTTNSTTVSANANITIIAAVKKWEGNLTKPEGFVIEFEIEEAKVKGGVEKEGGCYLTKSIAQTDANGKAYTNLNLELVNETTPVEVVVKASWHKGQSEGVSVNKSVNVTSAEGSEGEKVPVISLWGMVLLVVFLCLVAVYCISRDKG